ncbi:MAG: NUMOD4 motif-containing HNH endonuclease [Oscillospiraceae bacterium]|nr:NUMOD4 motif-containing HNH endonuclease [Oscillospiraceae bacterium]
MKNSRTKRAEINGEKINAPYIKGEHWKPIKGYNKKYYISNKGRIYSFKNNRLLKEQYIQGYLYIELSNCNKRKKYRIHRLVAIYFIPNPENKREVHHKDGNALNNDVNNLMWVTCKEHKALHAEMFKQKRGIK